MAAYAVTAKYEWRYSSIQLTCSITPSLCKAAMVDAHAPPCNNIKYRLQISPPLSSTRSTSTWSIKEWGWVYEHALSDQARRYVVSNSVQKLRKCLGDRRGNNFFSFFFLSNLHSCNAQVYLLLQLEDPDPGSENLTWFGYRTCARLAYKASL